jgi:hypothetical protein
MPTIRSVSLATARMATLAALALPVMVTGCKQASLCPGLDVCGGDLPVGDWVLAAGHASCSDDLYTPAPDSRLVGGDLPPARTPPPEPALYDWCSLLVATDAMDIKDTAFKLPNLYVESPPIGTALIRYQADRKFFISTRRIGNYKIDFPPYCMRAFGAVDSPGATVCDKLTASLTAKLPSRYKNVHCTSDGDTTLGGFGCNCTFDLSEIQESKGTVLPPNGGPLFHLFSNTFPQNVSYCASPDRLQLSSANDEYLFDRLGLRTLDLAKNTTPINCTDHMQGYGEDGVDCGPACPVFCADINCFDGAMGPGEEGVDCGPNCPTTMCPPAI